MATDHRSRSGWREKVSRGLYRYHRVSCPSTSDHKPGRRCGCPFAFQVPTTDPRRFRTVTVTGTLTEAREQQRRLLAAGPPPPAPVQPEANTLEEFVQSYLQARAGVLAPDTIRNRDEDYCARIGPELGALTLPEITRERVERWLAHLVATASSRRMVVQTVATLRVILGTAVAWGRLAENPAAKLPLPPPETEAEQAVERVLDADQLRCLFDAAGSLRTETMFRAAGEAGLRRGEVSGLRWSDVDLAARRLSIRRAIVQERKTEHSPMRKVERTTKGRRARRVAITAAFAARLSEWYEASVIGQGASADGYVWPGKEGGPIHDRTFARAVERACVRAGLVENPQADRAEQVPLVTPHGLRHTCASIMLARGVSLLVVSRQLGHANPNITATIYAHLLNDSQLDEAAAVFESPARSGAMWGATREELADA